MEVLYSIEPLAEREAHLAAAWRYEGEYAFYNHSGTPEERVRDLLDGTHYACLNESGALIGTFSFGADARIPTVEEGVYDAPFLDVGLGLRPDLCGRGLGEEFVRAGLVFAHKTFGERSFRLSVAQFNRRAIKVYERVGFRHARMVTNSCFLNQFVIMTIPLFEAVPVLAKPK